MKNKRRRMSISLSAMTILSITVASAAAVAICIAVFASVYSNALLRDAKVNSEQSVQQTAVAINNYLSSMKDKITVISGMVTESENARNFDEKISGLANIQKDIYAVTVYDGEGNIVSCTGSGLTLKSNVYNNLSFDKELFDSAEDFALTSPQP